jgi:hypothetical protein
MATFPIPGRTSEYPSLVLQIEQPLDASAIGIEVFLA